MSHITDVKLQIKDLDALEEAAKSVGLTLARGKKTYTWYGRFLNDSVSGRQVAAQRGTSSFGRCDHALQLASHRAGDYEIGVVSDGGGTYSLLFDEWGPGQRLIAAAGANLNKLRQEYAVAVATKRAQPLIRKGFVLSRELLPSGVVRLNLRQR